MSSKIRTTKDYDYRSGNYSQIDGSICTNNNDFEGYAFGKYKCPIEGFSTEAVLCCDEPGSQFCCVPLDGIPLYKILLIVAGIALTVIMISLALFACKKCRENYDKKYYQPTST